MPRTPEEWIAAATVANAILVLVLVAATVFYAAQTKKTVDELREARVADSLPVLHWQRHPASAGAGYRAGGLELEITLHILLTNVGPGPARLLEFEATTTNGERWQASEMATPSTLPAHERIELRMIQKLAPRAFPGSRETIVRVCHTDLAHLRTYETRPHVTAHWLADGSAIDSFDADERSPQERQLRADG
ncbi:MAG: hypothetical protein AABM40_04265 [Chloroflexota bacterium]